MIPIIEDKYYGSDMDKAQQEITSKKHQLEKYSQSQRESLISAEVEIQSAKIQLENVASALASKCLNKDKLNTIIKETNNIKAVGYH